MPDGGSLLFRTGNLTRGAHEPDVGGLGPGDYVVIEVIDTGAGIPPDVHERIFEPFFSNKQFGVGTGLGLSMVFGFAKQSGGSVVVESEEGKGACFRILLPRAEVGASDAPDASDAPTEADGGLRGGTETILCVEDDDVVRAHVIGRLESLGYKVIAAANAAQALEVVHAGTAFDMLFTDIVMPGAMNGKAIGG